MNDEITDEQSTRFILIFEQLGYERQHVVEARLSGGVGPCKKLIAVLPNNEREAGDSVLSYMF